MIHVRLSGAQVSALECRDLSESPVIQAAWRGRALIFPAGLAADLWDELTEASNAEDAFAEIHRKASPECAKYAARAARSLGCVAGKVLAFSPRYGNA